jgi:DNA-directed RNA polymerase subunit RPC12/RpoP
MVFKLDEKLLIDCPCCGSKVLSGFWFKCYNCNSEFLAVKEGIKKINGENEDKDCLLNKSSQLSSMG